MDISFSTLAIVVLVVLGVIGLAIVGTGIYVLVKYRVPLRGIVAAVSSLAYLLTPVDVAPEALLGPFGLVDDAGILAAAAVYISRLVAIRRALADPAADVVAWRERNRARDRSRDAG
ncbi:DUF1232 domain-containing protein [Frankia sp. CNm7]|uniref:DUF1232 domain-containing protein n=1 Tax=Frankia nepalensis TaxID=1836974 RepID=A0A937RLS6_9ACTN|nr:YkvA family protein [Frankia nepalensis]MBL7499352.1 DUF1232 domain-containing protein [Frankia nepalensis]MBL7514110.1 DUF1232 domain-containing protein [Frankia nepalensis]MBL7519917.1 DUF1232 domain-containing protein [Frankia nepalensis]MBL7632467.1 DUF1232 domain-containing protein [Frankia nepalensis]